MTPRPAERTLKAQQMFAVTNAVAALAEESGMTQDAAVSATLEAFGNLTTDQLDSLVGEMSTTRTRRRE